MVTFISSLYCELLQPNSTGASFNWTGQQELSPTLKLIKVSYLENMRVWRSHIVTHPSCSNRGTWYLSPIKWIITSAPAPAHPSSAEAITISASWPQIKTLFQCQLSRSQLCYVITPAVMNMLLLKYVDFTLYIIHTFSATTPTIPSLSMCILPG